MEQVPGLTRRHGRVTERLRQAMSAIGLALAGRAGARLAQVMGIATSRTTLLRRAMDLPDPIATQPRADGVDDFALRRGHVYGTVVIDAETHQVLDLLPERDAATLAPWLAAHPGIEVICRDRADAYAEAADTAAPQALQVADRFHLWQNIATAVEKTVADHRSCLRDLPPPSPEPDPAWETPTEAAPGQKAETDDPTGKFAERAHAHHTLVHDLLAQGMSLRGIAHHLGWGRHTVQRYARTARWQDMIKGPKRQLPRQTRPVQALPGRPLGRDRRTRDHPRFLPGDHRTRLPRPLLHRPRLDPPRPAAAGRLHGRPTTTVDTTGPAGPPGIPPP